MYIFQVCTTNKNWRCYKYNRQNVLKWEFQFLLFQDPIKGSYFLLGNAVLWLSKDFPTERKIFCHFSRKCKKFDETKKIELPIRNYFPPMLCIQYFSFKRKILVASTWINEKKIKTSKANNYYYFIISPDINSNQTSILKHFWLNRFLLICT